MTKAEQDRQVGLAGLLEQLVERCLNFRRIHALPRGVANVQDHIRDRRVVERAVVDRKLQFPSALRARALEWEESFVRRLVSNMPAPAMALLVRIDWIVPV